MSDEDYFCSEEWKEKKRKAFEEAKGVPGQKKWRNKKQNFTPKKKKRK
jgi:hypothetical protein